MSDKDNDRFVEQLQGDPTKRAKLIADIKSVLKTHGLSDTALNAMSDDPGGGEVTVYRDGPNTSRWIVS